MANIVKLCFIDTETTGTNPRKNGLIQIAGSIAYLEPELILKIKERFNFPVRPYDIDVIEDSALEVNKHTRDEIMKYPEPAKIHLALVQLFGKYVDKYEPKDKFFFAGYKVDFDNDFMREFFKKNGDQYFGSWFFNPALDVMQIALDFLLWKREQLPDFKLGTVAQALNVSAGGGLHDANVDIKLTEAVYAISKGITKIVEQV